MYFCTVIQQPGCLLLVPRWHTWAPPRVSPRAFCAGLDESLPFSCFSEQGSDDTPRLALPSQGAALYREPSMSRGLTNRPSMLPCIRFLQERNLRLRSLYCWLRTGQLFLSLCHPKVKGFSGRRASVCLPVVEGLPMDSVLETPTHVGFRPKVHDPYSRV